MKGNIDISEKRSGKEWLNIKGQQIEHPNIFLIQNKGKGPPGGWPGPAVPLLMLPDHNSIAVKSTPNKYSKFNKLPNTNFQIYFTIKNLLS